MSEAAKSIWFWPKLLRPMTEDDTCQLMLSPYSVDDWPTHCWMATLAKLEPVDCIDGLAAAGTALRATRAAAADTMTAAVDDAERTRAACAPAQPNWPLT